VFYCGLDVSLRLTALCIMDHEGRIVREAKLASDPVVIDTFLGDSGFKLERIGIETGGTSLWLYRELRRLGYPAICIDARHAAAALQAGLRNKNDRNDARGIAELMRVKAYREVWVKSAESQHRGMLLAARGTLHGQRVALENVIRGFLRLEGITLPVRSPRFTEEVLTGIADLQGPQQHCPPGLDLGPRDHLDGAAGSDLPAIDDDPRRGRAHGAILQSLRR
jgi:transposase